MSVNYETLEFLTVAGLSRITQELEQTVADSANESAGYAQDSSLFADQAAEALQAAKEARAELDAFVDAKAAVERLYGIEHGLPWLRNGVRFDRTTFSRQTAARVFGFDKTLNQVAVGVLRADSRGALVEVKDTNRVPSSVPNSDYWATSGNVTIEQTNTVSPSGEKAARITVDCGRSNSWVHYASVSANAGVQFPVNGFLVKPGSARYAAFCSRYSAAIWSTTYYDLRERMVITDGHPTARQDRSGLAYIEELNDGWFLCRTARHQTYGSSCLTVFDSYDPNSTYQRDIVANNSTALIAGVTMQDTNTTPILTSGSTLTRAGDFLDAPSNINQLPLGPQTWKCAVRMPRAGGQPTVFCTDESRVYAQNGRLHLDGPGVLTQPDGDFAYGDYLPFLWDTNFRAATPNVAIGRDRNDANYWNGRIVDIAPYPREMRRTEKNEWLTL